MDPTIALLAWAACAGLAYLIADSREAPDKGAWAMIGLFFGPFGLVGALLFAKPARV